jgi:hypothetical protein
MADDGTLAVDSGILTVSDGTLAVDGCTLTISSDTSMIDDPFAVGSYTLASASGTQTFDGRSAAAPRWATASIDLVASSLGQTTPSRLLAQSKDSILHTTRDRLGFNKDHCPPCADQGRKSLSPSCFIIFSFPQY